MHGVKQHMDADQTIEEFPSLIGHWNKYTSARLSKS
jgi:hypothetical protein